MKYQVITLKSFCMDETKTNYTKKKLIDVAIR